MTRPIDQEAGTTAAAPTVRTFLIADVRGYTRFTAEQGDEAAMRLAAEFARIARETVALHGGGVIELRGDEALAVFSSTRAALRAALEMQERFAERSDPSLPLRAGIGLDSGEAIAFEGGFRGAALNRAARLCSLAAAGEVLATDGVVHLAGRVDGLEYADRGAMQLRGFAQPVAVVEVKASGGDVTSSSGEGGKRELAPTAGGGEEGRRGLPIGGFLGSLPAGMLVGRQQELKRVLAAVEAAAEGRGQTVLLAGEPGAGKTRLAQEATLHVRNRDFVIAAGRCYEAEQSVPYYPFLDALTDIYRQAPPGVRGDAARRWPYLGAILRDQIGVPEVAGGSGEDERQWVLRAVTGFLDAVAERAPIALLLDDLHWADASSLALLLHIARHSRSSRVLILGTYRDVEVGRQHPLESALRELQREGLAERIAVQRLSQEGTRGLIATTMGEEEEVSDEFTELVHSRTEGNPFFVQHVLRVLVERGDIFQRDGRWDRKAVGEIEVPESVRSAIGQRLSRLSERAQEALSAASVLGQTFQFEELQQVGGYGERDLEEGLDEAIATGLVRDMGHDGYSFDHALTQQSLYAELSSRRKRRLHLAAGEALEGLPERKREARSAEIAWHFLQGDDPERALPWALLAGDRAEAVFAHGDAEQQYRTALELAGEIDDRPREAESLAKLGEVLTTLGRYDDAFEMLDAASATYQALGNRVGEVRVMAALGSAYRTRELPAEGLNRIEPFVAALEAEEYPASPESGALYAALGRLQFSASHYKEELQTAERTVMIARALGDGRLLARGEIEQGTALACLGRPLDALPLLERGVNLAEAEGAPGLVTRGANNAASVLWDLLELRRAEEFARRSLRAAEIVGDPADIVWGTGMMGVYPWLRGEWDEALRLFERSAAMARRLGGSHAAFLMTAPGLVKAYRGPDADVIREMEECLEIGNRVRNERLIVLAQAGLADNDWVQGRAHLVPGRLEGLMQRPGLRNDDIIDLLTALARACATLGEDDQVRALLERIASTPQVEPWSIPQVHMFRSLLLEHEGRSEEARMEYEESLRLSRIIPFVLGEALALSAFCDIETRLDGPEEMRRRYEAAIAIFERLGAEPLVGRTRAAMEKV